jgi:hypothetical protein
MEPIKLMTAESPLLRFILGVILIVLLDTIGAFASNRINFKYTQLIPLSFAIYAVIGFRTSVVPKPDNSMARIDLRS